VRLKVGQKNKKTLLRKLHEDMTVIRTVSRLALLTVERERSTRMSPRFKHAGIAGVLTGLGLALEFTFFMLGGYSPDHLGALPPLWLFCSSMATSS
jgi:hypothetical protein